MTMGINIDEFRQRFFGELDKKLLPLGFKYIKSKHGYVLRSKENWYFHFLVDCVKWGTSISVQTKISAKNLLWERTFNEICKTKYEGLKIWGVYPGISEFLDRTLPYKPEQSLFIYSEADIQKAAETWLIYFQDIGMPFMERITKDSSFSLQIVIKGRGIASYDRHRYLPIICKETGMDNKEIEKLCAGLEKEIDDINRNCPFSEEFKARWVEEYYKVKNNILNG
jgi:hypothetical protein